MSRRISVNLPNRGFINDDGKTEPGLQNRPLLAAYSDVVADAKVLVKASRHGSFTSSAIAYAQRRQLRHRCRETATRTFVFDPRLALESDYLRHRRNLSLFIRCPNPVLTFSLVRLGIERGGSVLPQKTHSRSRWGTHCNLGRRFNAKSTELHSSWPVPRCSVSWPWSSVWPATRKPS